MISMKELRLEHKKPKAIPYTNLTLKCRIQLV